MKSNAEELIKVNFPSPPSFPVQEFCQIILQRGYRNHKYDYDFDRLLTYLPEVNKKHINDMLAKAVLAHCFGERLSKDFRNWVRSQMDWSQELEDGGSSIGPGEEA